MCFHLQPQLQPSLGQRHRHIQAAQTDCCDEEHKEAMDTTSEEKIKNTTNPHAMNVKTDNPSRSPCTAFKSRLRARGPNPSPVSCSMASTQEQQSRSQGPARSKPRCSFSSMRSSPVGQRQTSPSRGSTCWFHEEQLLANAEADFAAETIKKPENPTQRPKLRTDVDSDDMFKNSVSVVWRWALSCSASD